MNPYPSGISFVADTCTGCRLCQKDCSFLQKYGLPGDIAEEYLIDPEGIQIISFPRNLCAAVCPVALEPSRMFLDLRREACAADRGSFPGHNGILTYEYLLVIDASNG